MSIYKRIHPMEEATISSSPKIAAVQPHTYRTPFFIEAITDTIEYRICEPPKNPESFLYFISDPHAIAKALDKIACKLIYFSRRLHARDALLEQPKNHFIALYPIFTQLLQQQITLDCEQSLDGKPDVYQKTQAKLHTLTGSNLNFTTSLKSLFKTSSTNN